MQNQPTPFEVVQTLNFLGNLNKLQYVSCVFSIFMNIYKIMQFLKISFVHCMKIGLSIKPAFYMFFRYEIYFETYYINLGIVVLCCYYTDYNEKEFPEFTSVQHAPKNIIFADYNIRFNGAIYQSRYI